MCEAVLLIPVLPASVPRARAGEGLGEAGGRRCVHFCISNRPDEQPASCASAPWPELSSPQLAWVGVDWSPTASDQAWGERCGCTVYVFT